MQMSAKNINPTPNFLCFLIADFLFRLIFEFTIIQQKFEL